MEPGGSMRHSQGLSNNSYPEPNKPSSPHLYLSLQGPLKKKLEWCSPGRKKKRKTLKFLDVRNNWNDREGN